MADSEQHRDALLLQAHRATNPDLTVKVGRVESTLDKFVDNASAAQESPMLKFANDFYTANQDTIKAAAEGFSSLDNKTIETAISTFSESAKVVIKGLEALGQVHPFIGVAVVAFKLVISLDLTRRENNQKVLALRVEMQDTMCVLFQLRRMKDPEDEGPDGQTIKDRLQPLIERIAKSVTECGSACDAYLKKGFLSRTLKSKIYENRLIGWVSVFEEHRIELERCLAVHTALGVDKANEKLDEQQATLKNIENRMLEIFKKLETPREKDISKFIEENGGIKACIEKDDLLTKLITKSGETVSAVAQRSPSKGNDDIVNARKTLQKELAEDVDVIFKRNLAVFEAKMAIQSQQIVDVVERKGSEIMSVLMSGSHEKIRDSDLQQLWREMGWKGTVKARHFVLALRDYFTDQFNAATEYPSSPQITVDNQVPTIIGLGPKHHFLAKPINVDDRWTLDIIDIPHMQAILEAIDDDGTGFITIKEANTFAVKRPNGWSLLQWLAFWAQGWHHSVTKYKNKIYLLIQQMHRDLEEIQHDNRFIVDWYLDTDHFRTIEQLLRSAKTIPENERLCPELAELTDSYTKKEEERLEQHLKGVGYDIDSPATVSIITGPGRVERYIFPLLYLVLRHHARIIKVACHHVLHLEEFDHWTQSLESLITIVKRRVETLGAIYKQVYLDPKTQLDNMAFGMFRLIWESPDSWNISDNSFSQWQDISTDTSDIPNDEYDPEFVKLLHYEVQDTFSYVTIDHGISPIDIAGEERIFPSDLTGLWTGHCYDGDTTSDKGLFIVRIDALNELGEVIGSVGSMSGKAAIQGNVQGPDESGIRQVRLSLHGEDSDSVYHLVGSYDPMKEIITGTYVVEGDDDEDDSEDSDDSEEEGEGGEDEGEGEEQVVDDEAEAQQGENGDGTGSENDSEDEAQEDEDEDEDEDGSENVDDDLDVDNGAEVNEIEVVRDAEDDSKGENHTFILTRTPPDLFRFRYPPTTSVQDLAKGRWSFARSAVMYWVQKKRWTKGFFKERIEERKHHSDLRIRDYNEEDELTPNTALTEKEDDELALLCDTFDPAVSGLYEDLVLYTADREPYLFNWECDVCQRSILWPGYMCLQCTAPDLTGVNICPDCIDQSVTVEHFIHHKTHSMLKTFVVLHDYRLSFLVRDSRLLVEKTKKRFKGKDTNKSVEDKPSKSKDKEKKLLCAYCNLPVSLPCYVCTTCRETFICVGCDDKKTPTLAIGPAPLHKTSHLTVRVYDSDEEKFELAPVDATIKRLDSLEDMVHTKVDDITTRLGNLEKKLDERLCLLESLIQRLLDVKST